VAPKNGSDDENAVPVKKAAARKKVAPKNDSDGENAVPAKKAAAKTVAPKKASAHSDSDGDGDDDAVSLWRGLVCNVIFTVPLKLYFFDHLVRSSTQSHQESRTQKSTSKESSSKFRTRIW
jgi:hypothetical protein